MSKKTSSSRLLRTFNEKRTKLFGLLSRLFSVFFAVVNKYPFCRRLRTVGLRPPHFWPLSWLIIIERFVILNKQNINKYICIATVDFYNLLIHLVKPKRVVEEVRLNCRTPKVYCVGVNNAMWCKQCKGENRRWLSQRKQRADMDGGGVGARQDFGDGLMTGRAIIDDHSPYQTILDSFTISL